MFGLDLPRKPRPRWISAIEGSCITSIVDRNLPFKSFLTTVITSRGHSPQGLFEPHAHKFRKQLET